MIWVRSSFLATWMPFHLFWFGSGVETDQKAYGWVDFVHKWWHYGDMKKCLRNDLSEKSEQMPPEKTRRRYQMSKRAESSTQTAADIFTATSELWQGLPDWRHHSGSHCGACQCVSANHHSSVWLKRRLFESCIKDHSEKMESYRDKAHPGDVKDVIRCLLLDYEAHGMP